MQIKDVMTAAPICCTPEDTALTAAERMKKHGVGALPVVDEKTRKLVGIITDRDLCLALAALGKFAASSKIKPLMTPRPFTCRPEDLLDRCEELMRRYQVRRIPVVDEKGMCVGIVAQADVALKTSRLEAGEMLAAISRPALQSQAAA